MRPLSLSLPTRSRKGTQCNVAECVLAGDVEMVILARALETNTVVKDLILASNKLPGALFFLTWLRGARRIC